MGRVHIESLDVLKAKEQLRKDDVYNQLNEIKKALEEIEKESWVNK